MAVVPSACRSLLPADIVCNLCVYVHVLLSFRGRKVLKPIKIVNFAITFNIEQLTF